MNYVPRTWPPSTRIWSKWPIAALSAHATPAPILFDGHAAGTYRRVLRRAQLLPDFRLNDETWASLQLPIELAFFLHSTPARRVVALYPSPGGATEAAVAPDAWAMLVEDNPVLQKFEPDVEALLVNRVRSARECYRVGVDRCYGLVGLIRRHWRGMSGGTAVWDEIDRFFADSEREGRPVPDLNFQVEGSAGGAVRRRAAAAVQPAHHRRRGGDVYAVALRCQVRRTEPQPLQPGGAATAWATCSAPRTAGARRCCRLCGRTSAS